MIVFLFLLIALDVSFASSKPHHPDAIDLLKAHVSFLTQPSLEGRMTGSPGEHQAALYVKNKFDQLGLSPAGDNNTYFQLFGFSGKASLGNKNILQFKKLGAVCSGLLAKNWIPMSFSKIGAFTTSEMLFVGYGIDVPSKKQPTSYHAYQNKDVRNKWVVVFRGLPNKISHAQKILLQPYASDRYKAFTAKIKGAAGIILIPNPAEKSTDITPFYSETPSSTETIFALSINHELLSRLLKMAQIDPKIWKLYQQQANSGKTDFNPSNLLLHVSGVIDLKQEKKISQNVLAILRVTPNNSKNIIIGAHLDHLGHGETETSRARKHEKQMIHYGADDNASGVASLLEIAAKLVTLKNQGRLKGDKNIIFAVWSGEEVGLLGSSYYLKTLKKNHLPLDILANLNLDMVGRLEENIFIQGVATSPDWSRLLKETRTPSALKMTLENEPFLATDSTSFLLDKIPILNFFTGVHDDYHTPRDTKERLNYDGMGMICEYLVALILKMESASQSMVFTSPKGAHHPTRRFHVYLGTIPDYAHSSEKGVLISGITPHSPADKAGLQPQDRMIELDHQPIHNLYDYTQVLSNLSARQPAQLTVLRHKKRMMLSIIPEERQ